VPFVFYLSKTRLEVVNSSSRICRIDLQENNQLGETCCLKAVSDAVAYFLTKGFYHKVRYFLPDCRCCQQHGINEVHRPGTVNVAGQCEGRSPVSHTTTTCLTGWLPMIII